MSERRKALEISDLTLRFGGVLAVDGVSFSIQEGERRGIIGPNGAGKTTLFRLLTGEHSPETGSIVMFGTNTTSLRVHQRARLGLGRTYQITNIFQALTVRENLELAVLRSEGIAFSPVWGRERTSVDNRVDSALETADLFPRADSPAAELSHGEQRQVEVAIALAAEPKILLLDEPAAGLSAKERSHMARTIEDLPRDITICIIEHDMDLALGLSDTVTCLDYGKVIATGSPAEIRTNAAVREVYLGGQS